METALPTSLCTVLLLVCVCPVVLKGDDATTADEKMAQLQEDVFEWREEVNPQFSTDSGGSKYNANLADLSVEALDTVHTALEQFISRTLSIDRGQLSERKTQYSYDVLLDMLNTYASNYPWRHYGPLNPINFMEGFYLDMDTFINTMPFNTMEDFQNYAARLEALPRQVAQMKDRMDQAIRNGTTYHNVSVSPVPGQISGVINQNAQTTPLYKPFNSTLDALPISQEDKNKLRSRAQTALQEVWQSLGSLKTYIENTYMPKTRSSYGVEGLPRGRDYYRACLKWHLSVDMSPEEVHQRGLQEVERITQLMRQVMTKQGFSGTISQYYSQLNADPQFALGSADAIIQAYKDLIFKTIYPKLPSLFKDIPDSKIEVKPLSYDGPYGMYLNGDENRPGTFYANLFRPNETKTYSMESLTLHEAVPGHHLQSIYQQAAGLPKFQKYADWYHSYAAPYNFPVYNAYVEGWALYAEFLGEEMGVYKDDYEMMGRYGDEIFRACRLVIDTGLHYKGWSRDQAIRYLTERTPMSQKEVEIEIDRYLTWPGQACSYKIGELKIKELRHNATKELGDKFDIHEFHSQLLNNGPVPLSLMETIVKDYISRRLTGAARGIHHPTAVATYLLVPLVWTLTNH